MKDDKTENPTDHRIKTVHKKGKIKYSRELNSFVILVVGLFVLCFYKNFIIFKIFNILSSSFRFNYFTLNNFSIMNIINDIVLFNIFYFFITISYPVIVVLIVAKIFSGIRFNFKLLTVHISKLNIIKGFKKLFSYQIILEFLKSILKLLFVIVISSIYLRMCFSRILTLMLMPLQTAMRTGFYIMKICFLLSIIAFIPIVIFDIYLQSSNYYKQFKMSRKEVKDELQKMEGNPYLKSRIRQAMRAIANRRMITDVEKSDVIIINPTSYAVALVYDDKTMLAPKVLAKGIDDLAAIIKKKAHKHCIPVLSAPHLARALYFHTKIGETIPIVLYKLVAEVLAWVWKIKVWKEYGGVFPKSPKKLFVPLNLKFLKKENNNG